MTYRHETFLNFPYIYGYLLNFEKK